MKHAVHEFMTEKMLLLSMADMKLCCFLIVKVKRA